MASLRPPVIIGIAIMVAVSVLSGLAFLAGNAPRDWSLHWLAPRTVVPSVSDQQDYAMTTTARGWNIMWANAQNQTEFDRFNQSGQRLGPAIPLRTPGLATPTGATVGNTTLFAWRVDTNGGSALRAAILAPGRPVRYRTLVQGRWPVEHPWAIRLGRDIAVLFSWQRTDVYDIWMVRVTPSGTVSTPIQLTHDRVYAFNPHAVMDPQGNLALVYMNGCCDEVTYRVMYERFSPAGRLLSAPRVLDTLSIGGSGSSSTPDRWGLDVRQDGRQTWVAWAGNQGLMAAVLVGNRVISPPHVAMALTGTDILTLSLAGPEHEMTWRQDFEEGNYLATVPLNSAALPEGPADRVAFESAGVDNTLPLVLDGSPALMWQSSPAGLIGTQIEVSHFTPHTIAAPSVWASLGLGLANPMANLVVLLVAGFAVGLLITVGNIITIFGLVILYFIISRVIRTKWKWYLYAAILVVALYAIFVNLDAPSPPILFLSALSGMSALVAICGMAVFIAALTALLRRMEDWYRAGIIAFAAVYFIAFLQALTLIQGQIGKV